MTFSVIRRAGGAGLLIAASLLCSATLEAQGARDFETRAQLEAAAQQAAAAGRNPEAYRIRLRISEGDFSPGDRIVVSIDGPAPLSDTLTVATGKKVNLPNMGDLSLHSVLRSELQERMQAHVSTFLRNAVVRVKPLVRIGVLGSVGRPGFYYMSADVPLTDVLMEAGGPATDADVAKVDIRRGTEVLVDGTNTRRAMTQGMSIDMLHMQAGDEIHVPAKRAVGFFNTILPAITAIAGVAIGLSAILR